LPLEDLLPCEPPEPLLEEEPLLLLPLWLPPFANFLTGAIFFMLITLPESGCLLGNILWLLDELLPLPGAFALCACGGGILR